MIDKALTIAKPLAFLPGTISYRLLEIIPGLLTWLSLLGAILLGYFKPAILANIVIIYDVYWFLRSIRFTILSFLIFKKINIYPQINWHWRLKRAQIVGKTWTRKIQPQEILQAIIVVHYKESYELLEASIKSFVNAKYDIGKQLIFVLASEERAGKAAKLTFARLKAKYGKRFLKFSQTIHPANLPGEIKGKSSNATFAARYLKNYFDQKGIDYSNVIVHNFDADTRVDRQYFSYLAIKFLETPKNEVVSYQPVHIYSNNIWDVPAIIRIVATSSTTIFMHNTLRPHRLRNFSSRSDCFKTIVDIDYWATDAIPEDSRQYWDSFFYYGGNVKIEPIYIPLKMDAVLAEGYFRTIQNQYQQLRRWAWGVSDFPYVISRAFADHKISAWRKMLQILLLLESHYSWANSSLIITIYSWLPFALAQNFSGTLLGYQLPIITSQVLTLAIIGLVVTVWISLFIYNPRPHDQPRYAWTKFIWQWLFVPIASVGFSSISAIDAQTRLMLGKYLEYQVTEKAFRHHHNHKS